MSDFITHLICPITHNMFHTAVIASDKVVYEAEIVVNLIINKQPSPISYQILKEDIKIVNPINQMIDMLITDNPELETYRYKTNFDINSVYFFSKSTIVQIFLDRGNYDRLLTYDKFILTDDIDKYSFKDFLRCANTETIIHFIDRCDNLEYMWEGSLLSRSWKVINYVCNMCSGHIIRHILDKNIDIDNPCLNGWRPIHYIASYHDHTTLKKILDKSVDLRSKTDCGYDALDLIVEKQHKHTVMYALNLINSLDETDIDRLLDLLEKNTVIESEEKHEIRFMMIAKLV